MRSPIVVYRRKRFSPARNEPGRGFRPKLCAGLCVRWGRLCGAPIWTAGFKLLSQSEGASIEEMMQATDWQQHSVRGFLAGTVKRKLGFSLTSLKPNDGVRRHRIETRRTR
jgi:Protein of unknown function (DUF3489)